MSARARRRSRPERPGAIGAAEQPPQQPEVGGRPEAGGGGGLKRNLQPAAGGEPGAPAGGERIAVEQAKAGSQAASIITDSLYENYTPQRVRVEGIRWRLED